MKISRKTLGIVAFFSASACLLLPSIGRSQVVKPRLKGPTIAAEAVKPVHLIPTEMDKLNMRIDELETKLAAQQKAFDAQQKTLIAQQKALDDVTTLVTARPKGYTKAFITLSNFNRLPGTDAISYWARN
ncbi:hypothetical protein EON83_24070 [bacterium]|nr:MAG: hypothetical protein EON83_24070 [bacterium]